MAYLVRVIRACRIGTASVLSCPTPSAAVASVREQRCNNDLAFRAIWAGALLGFHWNEPYYGQQRSSLQGFEQY
jgi:hypothetical protein